MREREREPIKSAYLNLANELAVKTAREKLKHGWRASTFFMCDRTKHGRSGRLPQKLQKTPKIYKEHRAPKIG